ncbi:MAG: calcium-binding protein, partial [Pseudomonadota bacterium]
MTDIIANAYLTLPGDDAVSHVTDLTVVATSGGTYLASTTRYDGVLRLWDINGGPLSLTDEVAFTGPIQAGGAAGAAVLSISGASAVITGGAAGGALQIRGIGSDGSFGAASILSGLPSGFAAFQHASTLTLPDSRQVIYGALANQPGIATLELAASGAVLRHGITTGSAQHPATQISATAITQVGGQNVLLSISSTANTLTSRQIDSDGNLGGALTLSPDDGLWISAPTALATASMSGRSYAVIGAAGSDSLTVVEVGTDGSLTIRDHIFDAREMRFGGVISLDVITIGAMTYVVAGGADDGLSLFVLLDGGMLIPRAHIEDTDDIGLHNISAVALHTDGTDLNIYATSSAEVGLTHLQYDTGTAGLSLAASPAGGMLIGTIGADVLQGGDSADTINGGAGADIIVDGAGTDVLTGGGGADYFVFVPDGTMDRITDFEVGVDRIDLSLWPMLRDISQLTISLRPDGMQISYGPETLIVQSSDGATIDYRTLATTDLIAASRLSQNLQPGFAGPLTPVPDPNNPQEEPEPPEPGPYDPLNPLA